jgi:hypothetical protein
VEVSRPISEQDAAPLAVGRAVALGIRRFHLLPTPISSYRIVGADASSTAAILAQPLFRQLLSSMRARVLKSDEPVPPGSVEASIQPGVTVLPSSTQSLEQIGALLRRGTRRLLCLPQATTVPKQVLIYCDSESSRRIALGLVASILRHVPAVATFVSIQSATAPRTEVANNFRRVLDARAELLEFHGLDIRTDVQIGELHEWASQLSAAQEGALVVLGLSGTPTDIDAALRSTFAPLFSETSRHAVLLSCSGQIKAEVGRAENPYDTRPPASAVN